jgi:hypothetical protein
MDLQTSTNEESGLTLQGTVSLFGFSNTEAKIEVIPRSNSWRRLRGGAFFVGGLALAPAVGMVPPHAPWALGALAVGMALGVRKWKEYFTLASFHGICPKCGGGLRLTPGVPAKNEMSVPCEGCHHDSRLSIPLPPPGEIA